MFPPISDTLFRLGLEKVIFVPQDYNMALLGLKLKNEKFLYIIGTYVLKGFVIFIFLLYFLLNAHWLSAPQLTLSICPSMIFSLLIFQLNCLFSIYICYDFKELRYLWIILSYL